MPKVVCNSKECVFNKDGKCTAEVIIIDKRGECCSWLYLNNETIINVIKNTLTSLEREHIHPDEAKQVCRAIKEFLESNPNQEAEKLLEKLKKKVDCDEKTNDECLTSSPPRRVSPRHGGVPHERNGGCGRPHTARSESHPRSAYT